MINDSLKVIYNTPPTHIEAYIFHQVHFLWFSHNTDVVVSHPSTTHFYCSRFTTWTLDVLKYPCRLSNCQKLSPAAGVLECRYYLDTVNMSFNDNATPPNEWLSLLTSSNRMYGHWPAYSPDLNISNESLRTYHSDLPPLDIEVLQEAFLRTCQATPQPPWWEQIHVFTVFRGYSI